MTKTVVAIFDDIAIARQVVEDLVHADFERNSISLITNDAHNQYQHYLDKDYVHQDDAVTAVQGASFGALVGIITGILAGAAALTIPGIGLAIVAGPIVAGLTGAVAGAVTGGIVGALVKSGIPEDDAPYYAESIRRGATLVSVETSDILRAQDIMHRQGSINIHERINLWRQDGWQGFDAEFVENKDAAQPYPDLVAVSSPLTTIPMVPMPVMPLFEEEPEIDNEDRINSHPVIVNVPATNPAFPVAPMPQVMTGEPVHVISEKGLQTEYEESTD